MIDDDCYEIRLDYSKDGDPARIFKVISDLLGALKAVDKLLLEIVGVPPVNTAELDAIEIGSIKARIKNLILDLPDEDLRDLNFKRLLGFYLVRAKYTLLKWCSEADGNVSQESLGVLSDNLIGTAEKARLGNLTIYKKPQKINLMKLISSVQVATSGLGPHDKIYYHYSNVVTEIKVPFDASPETAALILTTNVKVEIVTAVLQVKKPDYLGESKWEMRYKGRTISVTIADRVWLRQFQKCEVAVLPGGSVTGELKVTVHYDELNQEIDTDYELVRVRTSESTVYPEQKIISYEEN